MNAIHLIHMASSYQGFWTFMVRQFMGLGHQAHGCVLGLLGNEHGPTRWVWEQRWSGRTAPCYALNHPTPYLPNPDQ